VTAWIAGIGATEFSMASHRSELRLAVEAVLAALADAGIAPEAVDGLVTLSADGSPEIEVARAIGADRLTFTGRAHYGGADSCATVRLAAMAVDTGAAEVVVCYRAFNERSGDRYGQGLAGLPAVPTAEAAQFGWSLPFGLVNAAGWMGLFARRYLHEYGATSADFGRVTVAARAYAATNPAARFYRRPITLADHQRSRWVVEPLRLLDCCLESDGAVAVVVTGRARAADGPAPPVAIRAAAQGAGGNQHLMAGHYIDRPLDFPELTVTSGQLWAQAAIGPDDIQVAILYDHFTPMVLAQLEGYGFCPPGQAGAFVAAGEIGPGGSLPVNPHGGQLGEAYLHGMNGINEAVRQVRGSAVNQVANVEHVFVGTPPGGPTSGLILAPA